MKLFTISNIEELTDKGIELLEKGLNKGLDQFEKRLNSANEEEKAKVYKAFEMFENASDFITSIGDKINGTHNTVRPVFTTSDGVVYDTASKGARMGDNVGNAIAKVIGALTPEEWQQVGRFALNLAKRKLPLLADIDWDKIISLAENINDGNYSEVINTVNWKELAERLLAQKAASLGVPDSVIDGLLSLINTIINSISQENIFADEKSNGEIICSENVAQLAGTEKTSTTIANNGLSRFESEALNLMINKNEEEILKIAKELYNRCCSNVAFILFKELEEKFGNIESMYYLGEYYSHKYGFPPLNLQLANEMRKKGADLGNPLCQLNYALSLPEKSTERVQMLAMCIFSLQRLVDTDPVVQYELGCVYLSGLEDINVTKDFKYGIDLIKKSAENGNCMARHFIGESYRFGNFGLEINKAKAFELYEAGATVQFSVSLNGLATFYYKGDGVQQDYNKAIKFFKQAASLGFGFAAWKVAQMYKIGEGVESNSDEYNYWMQLANELGCPDGKI